MHATPDELDLGTQQALRAFLSGVDRDRPVVVVRWIDEPRITPEATSGFTVAHQTEVTLVASIGGQLERARFEGVNLAQLKRLLAGFPLRALYRSENQTR